jgi:outer membrane protein TolC
LSLLVVGCAGAKRNSVSTTKANTKSPFALASIVRPEPTRNESKDVQAQHPDTLQLVTALDQQVAKADEPTNLNAAMLSAAVRPAIPRDATSRPDHFRDLTEREMLALSLTNSPVLRQYGLRILENPSGATTIYDSAITASDPFFGPQAALAEFDSVLSASVNAQNNDRVFNNVIVGGAVQELVQDLATVNAGWKRRTLSGALLELNGINGYDNNNRLGNSFPNYWETQLEAGIRQPLMQGAGRNFNLIAGPNARPGFNFSNGILIARLNDKISDADFEIQVREFVRELYTAYWELDRLYRNYHSVTKAEALAYRTWQTVLAKSKANLTGGEANKEAQARAKYYSYRHDVQVALGGQGGQRGLYVAERRLRDLIGLPIVDGELLRPVDKPVDARFVFDYDLLISRAMADRTELQRQSFRVHQQQLRLVAAKNFLLPQMDLIGRYRLRGFGDDLTGSGPRFSSAYQDFFSFDHQEWEFGLEMGVVAGRRQAHAAVRNATLQLNRERSILAEQQQSIQLQLSDSYAEVASSYAAMETSQAQVDASRQRLDSSQALFNADKILIEFLLDAQAELLQAERQLAIDQARYTESLISLNAVAGSLLSDIGVHLQQTSCQSNILYLPEEPVIESTTDLSRLP